MTDCYRLRITGAVQGVGFRDWFVAEAQARGLDGWVRNRSDGSVEALIAGPGETCKAMIEAALRGPAQARVASVDLKGEQALPEPGFRRAPTL